MALPGTVCLVVALRALRRGQRGVQVWLLAALFALPAIDRSTGGDRLWLLACALLWLWLLAPWLLQPIGRYYFLW